MYEKIFIYANNFCILHEICIKLQKKDEIIVQVKRDKKKSG